MAPSRGSAPKRATTWASRPWVQQLGIVIEEHDELGVRGRGADVAGAGDADVLREDDQLVGRNRGRGTARR